MPSVREGRPSHPRPPGGTQQGQNGPQAASSLGHLWTQSVWGLQWWCRPGRSLRPQTLPAVEKAEASCTPRPLLRPSLGALQLWAPGTPWRGAVTSNWGRAAKPSAPSPHQVSVDRHLDLSCQRYQSPRLFLLKWRPPEPAPRSGLPGSLPGKRNLTVAQEQASPLRCSNDPEQRVSGCQQPQQ